MIQAEGEHADVLLPSCWTTAGATSPLEEDQRSRVAFETRVAITADVGSCGFGITHADIVELDKTIGLEEARNILLNNGIHFVELETLMDWFTTSQSRTSSDLVRRDLLAAAEALPMRRRISSRL